MFLELQVVVIRPEESLIIPYPLQNFGFGTSCRDMLSDLSERATRESDEITRVRLEELPVDTRSPIVHTAEVRVRDELDEIQVARMGAREEGDRIEDVIRVAIRTTFRGDSGVDADDRINPLILACLVKFKRTVKVTHIRDREPRHPELLGTLREDRGLAESGEEREIRMDAEMDEGHGIWVN